jgi:hypothetical protein
VNLIFCQARIGYNVIGTSDWPTVIDRIGQQVKVDGARASTIVTDTYGVGNDNVVTYHWAGASTDEKTHTGFRAIGYQRIVTNARGTITSDSDSITINICHVISDSVVSEMDAAAPDQYTPTIAIYLVAQDMVAKHIGRGIASEIDTATIAIRLVAQDMVAKHLGRGAVSEVDAATIVYCVISTNNVILDQGRAVRDVDAAAATGCAL